MSTLSAIYRNALWISPPLICISAVLLGFVILSLVRLVRKAPLLSLPLVEKQEIEFREAGRMVLSAEGPRFSTRFARLGYGLSTEYGAPVKGRRTLLGATSAGVSRARSEVRTFEIPHPGRYVLRVERLGAAQPRDAEHRLVFHKPHLAQVVGHIIGLILAFAFFMMSVLVFVWRLLERGSEA